MNPQAKASAPLREYRHNLLGVRCQRTADDKVLGKPAQEAAALHPGLDLALAPFLQHMMEEYIGEDGCDAPTWHDTCLRVGALAVVHDAGTPPLPKETPYPPVLAPLAEYFSQTGPVKAIAGATHICLHAPPHPLLPAPLAYLVQCRLRAAPRSKAIGAVQEVLLVDRFEQHHDRSLAALSLARGCADGALTPVFLLAPAALDGRGLVASAAQTRMQVAQVLVKVFGLRLRCDPGNARGTGLARVTGGLPQDVLSDQGSQGRESPRRFAGRLGCKALQLGWDGW
jgi:hypothetical protein